MATSEKKTKQSLDSHTSSTEMEDFITTYVANGHIFKDTKVILQQWQRGEIVWLKIADRVNG